MSSLCFVGVKLWTWLSCRQTAALVVLALVLMTDFIDWKIKSLWYRNRWPITVASWLKDAPLYSSWRALNKCLDCLQTKIKFPFMFVRKAVNMHNFLFCMLNKIWVTLVLKYIATWKCQSLGVCSTKKSRRERDTSHIDTRNSLHPNTNCTHDHKYACGGYTVCVYLCGCVSSFLLFLEAEAQVVLEGG